MANGYNDEFFNGDDQSQSLENDAREIGDIAKDVKLSLIHISEPTRH